MLTGALPLLLNLTVWAALDAPTNSPPKLNVMGVTETVGEGAGLVPVKLADCGDPAASSVTVSLPVRVPPAVGVKVTLMVQLEERDVPQLFVCAKSPLAEIPEMLSGALPVFVNLTG